MKSGFISLVGRPNAGKSTLLNLIVGSKLAIVSDKPQTTRNRIIGVKNYSDGQIVFTDTPGIHRPLHRMNVRMVDMAVEAARRADVVGLVRDVEAAPGSGDEFVNETLSRLHVPVVLILNKVDLIAKPKLLPMIDRARSSFAFADIVPVSALDGTNVDRLEHVLLEHLPESEPLYPRDYFTDQPERFFVAEIVREKVLQSTRDELPFSTAVVVDRFEEPEDDAPPDSGPQRAEAGQKEAGGPSKGLMRLYCTILVERESQKPILVGRRGEMIKRIGTAARVDLERFFQARVYLDLRVKVRSDWREDDRVLDEIGIK